MADQVRALTDKSLAVVTFLQDNPGAHFGDEIAAGTDLNPKGIHGVMNALWKRGFVAKEKAVREVITVDADGNEVAGEKEYTVYSLTPEGIAYSAE
jgi:hypothetical protein